MEKDEEGIPTKGIVLVHAGGGGGATGGFHFNIWVFPLPSPGELKVHGAWPALGMPEASVVLNADDIRNAAARAHILWE